MAIELGLGDAEQCKNRTSEEDDGQEEAIEGSRDIITTDSKKDNVDGCCKDTTNTLQNKLVEILKDMMFSQPGLPARRLCTSRGSSQQDQTDLLGR